MQSVRENDDVSVSAIWYAELREGRDDEDTGAERFYEPQKNERRPIFKKRVQQAKGHISIRIKHCL
jgi:hypothetical protein